MPISFDIDLSNDLIYFLPSKNVQRFFFSFFSTFKIHRNIVALNVLSELKIRRTRSSKQINFHGLVDNPFSFSPSSCKAVVTRVVQISKAIDIPPRTTKVKNRRVAALTKTRFKVSARRVGGLKTHGSKVEGTRRRNKRGSAERVSFVVRALGPPPSTPFRSLSFVSRRVAADLIPIKANR